MHHLSYHSYLFRWKQHVLNYDVEDDKLHCIKIEFIKKYIYAHLKNKLQFQYNIHYSAIDIFKHETWFALNVVLWKSSFALHSWLKIGFLCVECDCSSTRRLRLKSLLFICFACGGHGGCVDDWGDRCRFFNHILSEHRLDEPWKTEDNVWETWKRNSSCKASRAMKVSLQIAWMRSACLRSQL